MCLGGLVVSMTSSHAGRRGFASRPGHTKDHHKNGTNCLPAWHACMSVLGGILTKQTDCHKGCVVWRTVYEDMHFKRSPGINHKSRVLYPSPGFLSSATWPSML